MTLHQMSFTYRASAEPVRRCLAELRLAERTTADRAEAIRLRRRMAALRPMLRQLRKMAELTEHYYERGYYRNEKYRI